MSIDALMVWTVGLALGMVATGPVLIRLWNRERRTDEAEARALRYGLSEPASLHPVVDPLLCIGTGSCVEVCPEGMVLGFRNGQAIAVAPASCIGHGLCERACPVEAIQLVFGTEKRGVDIPRVKEDFQTNVPGLYIIGELGGMGLIRNAFEQGRQCIEGIAAKADRGGPDQLDLIIVGSGPAGLSASLYAQRAGLRFVTLEKEPDLGGTVRHYPRKKLVMTQPLRMPGYGTIGAKEIQKEDLIAAWQDVAAEAELPIHTDRTVHAVEPGPHGLVVKTNGGSYLARRVILAIGRRGIPRKLGVPGEELANVQYALAEPEEFQGDRVLVVGGGDSAVEAAMTLGDEPYTKVSLSYRGDRFNRIKPDNRSRLEASIARGDIKVHWGTHVSRIEEGQVWLSTGRPPDYPLDNDQVFVFAGGELPMPFLRSCGVQVDTKFGAP